MKSKGTVRWFNRTIGAGFIRTDDGEKVLFLNSAIKGVDPKTVQEGMRVIVEVLKNQYGLKAANVRAAELPG